MTSFPPPELSPAARAYHDEYSTWFWDTNYGRETIAEKRAALRAKYGEAAEDELMNALRNAGLLGDR